MTTAELLIELVGWPDADAALVEARRRRVDVQVRELAAAMERALGGGPAAARDYVERYRALVRQAVEAAREIRVPSVGGTPDLLGLLDVSGTPSRGMVALLDQGAVQAPFSEWVQAFGAQKGLVLDVASRVRSMLPGVEPLPLPRGITQLPGWNVDEGAVLVFVRTVRRELDAGVDPLEAIAARFGLNETELAALFGVRRQAIGQWRFAGIPAARREKVATVAATADLLARQLKIERLPGLARRPAEGYGGRTMLELIAEDRHRELLDSVRASFEWSRTA